MDSILIVDRKLNATGHTILVTVYEDCDLVNATYDYAYEHDTIIKSKTKYEGESEDLKYITYLGYNDRGQHISSEAKNAEGEILPITLSKKYNKKGELTAKF